MNRSQEFAHLLAGDLQGATVRSVENRFYHINARLDTGVVVVGIEVCILWNFRDLKRHAPLAWCLEPWMKTGADWHNGPPMCWVLPRLWRDVMNWKGKPVRAIMSEGRQWLLNDTRCLINRHYTAHLEGIDAWPQEWTSWSHGDDGIREYERLSSAHRGGHHRNKRQ